MKSLKGHLLIATTKLDDPNFAKSVVLIFDHNDEGAAGIVLNRPSTITLAKISEQVFELPSSWEKPIHLGGPVTGPLGAAHTMKNLADMEVMPGIYGALAPNHLQQLIKKQQEPTLFLMNYSGWGPGQLESELEEDAWQVMPARVEHIFWSQDESLWEVCSKEAANQHTLQQALGIRIMPRDPGLN